MKSRDQQLLEEAYNTVYKNKPKQWDWDHEIVVDGVLYHVQANYTSEKYHERETDYYNVDVNVEEVEIQDAESEQPITKENNPELYNKVIKALELKIQEEVS